MNIHTHRQEVLKKKRNIDEEEIFAEEYDEITFQGYSFLCVTIFFSSVFLSTMLALRVTGSLEKAIRVILLHIPYEETFCAFISPILECRILRRNSTDLIEHQCGPRAENVHFLLLLILFFDSLSHNRIEIIASFKD